MKIESSELYPVCEEHGAPIVADYAVDEELRRRYPGQLAHSIGEIAEACDAVGEHPHARVREGWLVCDECNRIASHIHFLPEIVGVRCIKGACFEHDPGGYSVPLDEGEGFAETPFEWLHHLAGKNMAEGSLLALLEWLDYDGAQALDARIRERRAGPQTLN